MFFSASGKLNTQLLRSIPKDPRQESRRTERHKPKQYRTDLEYFLDTNFKAKYQKNLNRIDAGLKHEPIVEINYAAFIDSQWHNSVLWVCEMIGKYTMTELWGMDIVRFTKLTFEARTIESNRKKQAMKDR